MPTASRRLPATVWRCAKRRSGPRSICGEMPGRPASPTPSPRSRAVRCRRRTGCRAARRGRSCGSGRTNGCSSARRGRGRLSPPSWARPWPGAMSRRSTCRPAARSSSCRAPARARCWPRAAASTCTRAPSRPATAPRRCWRTSPSSSSRRMGRRPSACTVRPSFARYLADWLLNAVDGRLEPPFPAHRRRPSDRDDRPAASSGKGAPVRLRGGRSARSGSCGRWLPRSARRARRRRPPSGARPAGAACS